MREGRPKTEFANDVETLHKKARMLQRGLELVDENWDDIVNAMIELAVKKKSVMASVWLRDTFIGKPKEIQVIEQGDSDKPFTFQIVKTS